MVQVIGAESMNGSQPVFVNILVTSPSEDTYSIYTLRLSYDNLFTPKFSVFQFVISILLLGSLMFVIGFFTARFLQKRKLQFEADLTAEDTEVIENVENENMPMV